MTSDSSSVSPVTAHTALESQFPAFQIFPATARSAHTAREFVMVRAGLLGFSRDDLADMEVAVGEAVTNAILYPHAAAPLTFTVAVRVQKDALHIAITDQGNGFQPDAVRETPAGDGEALGGRGILLMRALVDAVHFDRDASGHGMTVTLIRHLPTQA